MGRNQLMTRYSVNVLFLHGNMRRAALPNRRTPLPGNRSQISPAPRNFSATTMPDWNVHHACNVQRATCSVVPTRINNVPLFNFSPDSYAPVASGLKCTPVISKWYEQYVLKLIGCYSTPSFVPRWHWTRNKWYQALGISYMEFRACEKSISRFFPSC